MARDERKLNAVPRGVRMALLVTLVLQIAWQWSLPRPTAAAAALEAPLRAPLLRAASLNETAALAQLMSLYLQAYDNQPGISIPFRELDYRRVLQWLEVILQLDPAGQYPLFMAAQIYSQVPDPERERMMLDFVHRHFRDDPERRWRWLAHATIMAKHRLRDDNLALQYARDITRYARSAPGWARQMQVFILEDIGEIESAKILLGGLLESGEIRDEREIRFLLERLKAMKSAENPSPLTKN